MPYLRNSSTLLSPLRYPGGKRRLAGYVAEALKLNGLRPKLYVEPFAGGASVALQLLADDVVETIALGEKDPLVASFWKVVFSDDYRWLIRQLERIEPSLELWRQFRNGRYRTDRQRALACIFLNRTSFSGILSGTAGPIGGHSGNSRYDIGCRFARTAVIRRIEAAAAFSHRVKFIHQGEWRNTITRVNRRRLAVDEVFYYLDPPFYHKADRLYRHYFANGDHQALHDAMARLRGNWILSYDPAEPIIDLYSRNGIGPKQVELLYSATGSSKPSSAQELIVSNLEKLPEATRVWRSVDEWKGGGRAEGMKDEG